MTRIMFVTGQLQRGGAERQLLLLATALRQRGNDCSVVCLNSSQETLSEYETGELPIIRPVRRFGRGLALASLIGRARALRPGVVHSYSFHSNFPTWLIARACGAAAVGAVRGDLVTEMAGAGPLMGRLCLRYPLMLACNSRVGLRAVHARRPSGVRRDAVLIPNAIDFARFPISMRGREPDGTIQIAGVGNLLHYKRWDRAIRALATLRQEGLPAVLTIYGEGEARRSLEQLAGTLGIADAVRMPGSIRDLESRLSSADLMVHTAATEGSPNAVMEAMAAGLACVSTRVGDVELIIQDSETGFIVEPDDDRALAGRLAELCRSPELRRRMGDAARSRARANFQIETTVGRVVDLYRSLGRAA